jgi:hypothetical protein
MKNWGLPGCISSRRGASSPIGIPNGVLTSLQTDVLDKAKEQTRISTSVGRCCIFVACSRARGEITDPTVARAKRPQRVIDVATLRSPPRWFSGIQTYGLTT